MFTGLQGERSGSMHLHPIRRKGKGEHRPTHSTVAGKPLPVFIHDYLDIDLRSPQLFTQGAQVPDLYKPISQMQFINFRDASRSVNDYGISIQVSSRLILQSHLPVG